MTQGNGSSDHTVVNSRSPDPGAPSGHLPLSCPGVCGDQTQPGENICEAELIRWNILDPGDCKWVEKQRWGALSGSYSLALLYNTCSRIKPTDGAGSFAHWHQRKKKDIRHPPRGLLCASAGQMLERRDTRSQQEEVRQLILDSCPGQGSWLSGSRMGCPQPAR